MHSSVHCALPEGSGDKKLQRHWPLHRTKPRGGECFRNRRPPHWGNAEIHRDVVQIHKRKSPKHTKTLQYC